MPLHGASGKGTGDSAPFFGLQERALKVSWLRCWRVRFFTANLHTFEHDQDFLEVFDGPETFGANKILDHCANPLDIMTPEVAIKQYPCCGSPRPVIDAMIEIVRTHRMPPMHVTQINHAEHLQSGYII
ncbi:MAG: hypothetical protein ACRD10_13080 [Terriglobia bacterium]